MKKEPIYLDAVFYFVCYVRDDEVDVYWVTADQNAGRWFEVRGYAKGAHATFARMNFIRELAEKFPGRELIDVDPLRPLDTEIRLGF